MPVGERKLDQFRGYTGLPDRLGRIVGAGFDVTEECNLACPGCYRLKSKLRGHTSPEAISSNLDKLQESGATEVYFLGAEPTVSPHLPQVLQIAVDKGFEFILLISNGIRLADEGYARQVLIPGVSLLMQRHTLGSDALAQRIQQDSMGKAGSLEKSHQAWRNAETIFKEKSGKDQLMMQSCLTPAAMTDGNLDQVFQWAREELGTLPIMEYQAPPHTRAKDQQEWFKYYPLLTGQIVRQMERFRQIDEQLRIEVPDYKNAVSPQAYNDSCKMVKEGGQITREGVFLPCTNMGPDSTNPLRFGNISQTGVLEIEQVSIRQAFLPDDFRVKGCSDPCKGSGCWWTGLVTTGCYRLCQLNCVFNEQKLTIDDVPDLCATCPLNSYREEGVLNCGPGKRPGLLFGESEKALFRV